MEVDGSSKYLNKDMNRHNFFGYCCKKVLDYFFCTKCDDIFHPSCMSKSSSGKAPVCLHVSMERSSGTRADETDLKMLIMKNSLFEILS